LSLRKGISSAQRAFEEMTSIHPIFWHEEGIVILDQRALPSTEKYITCKTVAEVCEAIKNLSIRGAPAIGIAAAMAIALGFKEASVSSKDEARLLFQEIRNEVQKTRPTARNLFWAIERMEAAFNSSIAGEFDLPKIKETLAKKAQSMLEEDVRINMAIGRHGQSLIGDSCRILTHCNAGALATGGFGTALGVIRAAWKQGKKLHVFVDETRPVLQGMRLTAWELKREGIPLTIICDSAAGWFMSRGEIDLIICGADRIAANGDTANKIGTYSLAVLARAHGIPFYIAAPISTIDTSIPEGAKIVIEERGEEEVVCLNGQMSAPAGVKVANPAFDITPAYLISAIITERGVLYPPYGEAIQKILLERDLCNAETAPF